MSSALAIASVTAVLRNLLDNGMIDDTVVNTVGNVVVTARAPDLIALDQNATSQLNLFLYQVTPNQGWNNVGLPARDAAGERLTNPPLALDLHYFLTAYGARDLHAEILLGYAMQVLHQTPLLSREGDWPRLGCSQPRRRSRQRVTFRPRSARKVRACGAGRGDQDCAKDTWY